MRIDREVCQDYARSSRLEWLRTNRTGAFAMGTVAGANTRRYHGLLVAKLDPPADRCVLLSKLDEEVSAGGVVHELGTNQFPGLVHPQGYRHLREFSLPNPAWVYEAGGTRIQKRLLLVEGRQAVVMEYRASRACRLLVRPLLAFRDYHSLARANPAFSTAISEKGKTIQMRPYPNLPPILFESSGAVFQAGGVWHYNFEYLAELDRGLDFREDLYSPGAFVFNLRPDKPAWLEAGVTLPKGWRFTKNVRVYGLAARLKAAAGQFQARRFGGTPTVIAGFPWFTDWGRDTMIALPGLRLTETREILKGFLRHLHQGLIPNRFTERGGAPEYNTVDATLWMFQAVWAYEQRGGDGSFFYPAAREIVEWHRRGTLHGIRVDPADGLLEAGDETTNLTWMDARVDGIPVTPRAGKAVEVNALWYNALRMLAKWTPAGEASRVWWRTAKQLKIRFGEKFWNPGRNCLYDVIGPSGPDASLRPNQLFAVSLPFPLLERDRARAVVETVQRNLLTPFGLRTLAPGEPGYQGRYQGGPAERDRAYHQGTVWPWLLCPFVKAHVQAFGRMKKSIKFCRRLVERFEPELERGCLGSIGELYDGDPPHRPCGAPAQAWSVAALLEANRALADAASGR